jgi:hypothetical protein
MEGRSTTRGWKDAASREGGVGNTRVVSLQQRGAGNARVATSGCEGEGTVHRGHLRYALRK